MTVRRQASQVRNLHGLLRAGKGGRELWVLGHSAQEKVEVFDASLNRLETRTYPGVQFRGHGHPWKGGSLLSAEQLSNPMAGGFLLHLDAQGVELGRYPTGGLRPHEIVDCGEWLAIAHYGDRPQQGSPMSAFSMDVISSGVSFLRKTDLSLEAFYGTEGKTATTHLAPSGRGRVISMSINTKRVPSEQLLDPLAQRDGVVLLRSERYERGYEVYAPVVEFDALKGEVSRLDAGPASMRRGQSFAHDPSSGVSIGTFAASQTLLLRAPGQQERFINTLALGVPNPRGCAVLGESGYAAVSGNEDNVAIFDVKSGRLVELIGLPMERHSHMFWVTD